SKAKGLTVLFEVALTEAEQMKLATKRSLMQTHSSDASGSGADEGTGDNVDDDVDNQDGDGQVHPKFSTHDQEEKQDDENKEEEWSDDEAYDDKNQGANVEGKELDEGQMKMTKRMNYTGT
ncbi:hypothetical protein Tco_0860002, partial [Tanacetum coccineum]